MATKSLDYVRSKSKCTVPMITVVEEFELQYNENHIVEKVSVGETDLVKEVNSHANEVGLVNAVKNAIAHGEDPLKKFNKTGPGVPVAIDPNLPMDDLNEEIMNQSKEYQKIADSLGITVAQLKAAVANGTIGSIIEQKSKEPEKEKEGNE